MRYAKELVAVVVGLMVSAAAVGAAVSKGEIEKAVAGIGGYEVNRPRTGLAELERVVRETAGDAGARAEVERQLVALLEGQGATLEARNFACELLARIGTDASVPVLAKMLGDEKTVHMACLALGANPSAAAGTALREAAGNVKGKSLVCVVSVLGSRGDAASVGVIGKLAGDGDAAVAEAAVGALGRIGSAEAADALGKVRTVGAMREAASGAYLQCAIALAAAGKKAEGAKICKELLGEGEPALCRRGALVALINMSGAEAVPVILTAMGGKDRVMQATAIAQIRAVEGREVTERFANELPRVSEELQVLLIGALEDRGDTAAKGAIAGLAGSGNAAVRVAAIRTLGRLGDASSVGLLAKAAAEGKSETEKRAGLLALRRVGGEGVEAAIVEAMKAAKGDAKVQLIEVLSDRGASSAVGAILVEARGADAIVKGAALKALGQLAGVDALPGLLELLVNMEGDQGRREAEGAVVAVCKKQVDEGTRADRVLGAMASAQSAAAKASLIRVLRGIGNEKAFEAVKGRLNDADEVVKGTAVRAMADWPDGRARGMLLGICRTTTNETYRIVALRGCVRLLQLEGGQPTAETVKAYENLMAAAKRAEEKKLVLGGLTGLAHPAALRLAESCMNDPAVSAEAAVAMVNVADAIKAAYRDEAAAAMKKLAAETKEPNIRKQAEGVLEYVQRLGDYMTAWKVCGPFAEAGKTNAELFDIEFGPEKAGAERVAWQVLGAGPDAARPTVMSLTALWPGEHRVAYARTWVWSEKAQVARIELGVDDAAKVWLNEKVVLANNTAGACVPGSQKADLVLRKGWNELKMKLVQATGPWEFCMRVCKRDGSKLEGTRAACTPTEMGNAAGASERGVRLLDGKTFEGWDGPMGVFRIEDDAIVGGTLKERIPRNEFLTTKKEYGDFELRLKFKCVGKGVNAGIQIRSRRIPNNHEMIGYQADLGDGYWGCLYDESRRNRILAMADAKAVKKVLKVEDWNEYVIRCEGKRIRLWVNGLATVDYMEPDEKIEQVGLIGLQIHGGGPSEAWYRDIEIVELGR